MPDKDRAQDRAERRQHDRAERNEHMIRHFDALLDDIEFPANREEIRAEFRDAPDEIVGEEESLGSLIDRLDDTYKRREDVREEIFEELGLAEHGEVHDTEREEVAETRTENIDRPETIEEEEPDEDPRREPR